MFGVSSKDATDATAATAATDTTVAPTDAVDATVAPTDIADATVDPFATFWEERKAERTQFYAAARTQFLEQLAEDRAEREEQRKADLALIATFKVVA